MMPRRPTSSRDVEYVALRALAAVLTRLFRGRRNLLVLFLGLALGLAAVPKASAETVREETLLVTLERLDAARLSPEQRRELAQVARKTRNPQLAALAVETLRKVGDRESLPLLDAMAGGRLRVPKVDADALSVRARMAAVDVRMRVAERTIQSRLRAG
jgi:hypothetical protein